MKQRISKKWKFFSAIIIFSSLLKTGATTCNICNEVDIDQSMEIPGGEGVTCGQTILAASVLEEGTEECSAIQLLEVVCCPAAVDHTGSCNSCPIFNMTKSFIVLEPLLLLGTGTSHCLSFLETIVIYCLLLQNLLHCILFSLSSSLSISFVAIAIIFTAF